MLNNKQNKEGYIGVDGGKIWYKIVGSGNLTPLLILHGGMGFPHNYLKPLEKLSKNRSVIFYDQLGCGKSDQITDKKLLTLKHYVEELTQIIESLKLNKTHLFGHSCGSMLATDYTLAHPKKVKSLILASPVLKSQLWQNTWNKYLEELPKKFLPKIKRHQFELLSKNQEYVKAEEKLYEHHSLNLRKSPKCYDESRAGFSDLVYETMWGPNEFTCTGKLKNYDRTQEVSKIKIPVLFTAGKFDGADPKTIKYYQSLIPKSQIAIFEKSAHFPHLEEPKKYLDTIRNFLNSIE